MMYKLFHKLFGWDYVLIKYGFDWYQRRVRFDAYGEPYVIVYGDMCALASNRIVYLTRTAEKLGR